MLISTVSLSDLVLARHTDVKLTRSPYYVQADDLVEKIADRWSIKLPGFKNYNTMSAFMFPDASLERLVTIGCLNDLLFYIDDVYGNDTYYPDRFEEPELADRNAIIETCIAAFRGDRSVRHSNRLAHAFAEIRERCVGLADPEWLERFSESLEEHLIWTVKAGDLTPDGAPMDVDTYISVREQVSGMYPTVDLIEFALGICLPDYVLNDPTFQALKRDCAWIACLSNDLFSYHKEVVVERTNFNLVQVMMHQYQWPFEEAVGEAIQIINDATEHFYETDFTCDDWDATTCAMVAQYINGLRNQISATWHWQMSTNRYRSPDSPFPELRHFLP
jgi:hypothetical protein